MKHNVIQFNNNNNINNNIYNVEKRKQNNNNNNKKWSKEIFVVDNKPTWNSRFTTVNEYRTNRNEMLRQKLLPVTALRPKFHIEENRKKTTTHQKLKIEKSRLQNQKKRPKTENRTL